MLRSDDRFARQNRCGLPPCFRVASPCPSIDHHLSGRELPALDQLSFCSSETVRGCELPTWRYHHYSKQPKSNWFTFITRVCFQWAQALAGNSHSLVRVSRRVEENNEFDVNSLYNRMYRIFVTTATKSNSPEGKRDHGAWCNCQNLITILQALDWQHNSGALCKQSIESQYHSLRFNLNGFTNFSLSLQSTFQLSLTVLVHYRSRFIFSFWRDLSPSFKLNFQSTLLSRLSHAKD